MTGRLSNGALGGVGSFSPEFMAEGVDAYAESVTYVDNETSQTIVGTPVKDAENSKYYIPIAFGVSSDIMADIKTYNEAESDHKYHLWNQGKIIINYDNEITAECMGVYYSEDIDENIIATIIEVDGTNKTTISNDNIVSITICDDDTPIENLTELTPVEGCYFPDVVEFTPAGQTEGE